jgi:hypothetical protein
MIEAKDLTKRDRDTLAAEYAGPSQLAQCDPRLPAAPCS